METLILVAAAKPAGKAAAKRIIAESYGPRGGRSMGPKWIKMDGV